MTKEIQKKTSTSIGKRIKFARYQIGFSQEKLGEMVGVTGQQIQKYEMANGRVSSPVLYQIAVALDKPIEWFFQELSDRENNTFSAIKKDFAKSNQLLSYFNGLDSPPLRNLMVDIARSISLADTSFSIKHLTNNK